MSRGDVESASTSLRGTLRGVQVSRLVGPSLWNRSNRAKYHFNPNPGNPLPNHEQYRSSGPKESGRSSIIPWSRRESQREASGYARRTRHYFLAWLHDQPPHDPSLVRWTIHGLAVLQGNSLHLQEANESTGLLTFCHRN